MKRWPARRAGTLAALVLALGATLAVLLLVPSRASASTLADCLARQHVCVTGDGRSLVSGGEQSQLGQQIGGDGIYLVVAASGSAGYDSTMNQVIGALSGHPQFTVGFLDSRLNHFGAYNKGMLTAGGAAGIATQVVEQHQADQNVFAALTDFVNAVQDQAGSGPGSGAAASAPSDAPRNAAIGLSVVLALAALGFFLIARPIRRRWERELTEAKRAAQDDLIALSTRLTDQDADVSIHGNPEAAEEQGEALNAYERGTAALDAARRPRDMGAVSRAIAEGQYHLASAEALAAGQPRPDRRPSCFFDPRHGMSVSDVYWTPADGGPPAPSRPAPPVRTRSSRVSSPPCARSRPTAAGSATSTRASPRRTGAATASPPACSPGSCSERCSPPTRSSAAAIPPATAIRAAGTTAAAISAAVTSVAASAAVTSVAGISNSS